MRCDDDPYDDARRGDVYESLGYDSAERRVVIDLDAAFGSVSVVWIN